MFTYDLLKKYPELDATGIWSQITGAKASGNKVTVTFKQPNVPFVGVLAAQVIVPEHVWSSIKDPAKFTNTKPVGTGPFTLEKFAPTQYTLKKNPDYWQADKIAPDQVVMPAQSTNQSTNQLDVTSGKFDWAYNYLPDVEKTYVGRDRAQHLLVPAGRHHRPLHEPDQGALLGRRLPQGRQPGHRPRHHRGQGRQRLRDRREPVRADPAQPREVARPVHPGLRATSRRTRKGALAEFKKAGYTQKGGKLVDASGKQVSMSIMMPSNYSDWVAGGKELVNELGAIGIKASLDTPDATQYTSATQSGNYDVGLRRVRRHR